MTPEKPVRRIFADVPLYSLVAVLVGALILLIVSNYTYRHATQPEPKLWLELGREFGALLVSVFGVSYLYEKLSADRNFERFHKDLEHLVRQGESNAAMCASLGILELHADRKSYEDKHNFTETLNLLVEGDSVRIIGRSLIFAMYGWSQFQHMLKAGAQLQLCLFNPEIDDSPLKYLAGYSVDETRLAVHRFMSSMHPWLLASKAAGSLSIRFHGVHLLDSLVHIESKDINRVAWDLNFGEGTEARHIILIDALGALGQRLVGDRYQPIWDHAMPVYEYNCGRVSLDLLTKQSPEDHA